MANPGFLGLSRLGRILFLLVITAGLQGCIYWKPAYSGRVLEAETGLPIKDVVIRADYSANSFGFVDTAYKQIKFVKVATDKEGYFDIPSVFRIISPLSWEEEVSFSAYKHGYVRLLPCEIGDCFSAAGCEEIILDIHGSGGKIYVSKNLIRLSRISK